MQLTLKRLFKSKEKWNKDFEALDKNGNEVNANNKKAVSWCLIGGVERCYGQETKKYYAVIEALNAEISKRLSKKDQFDCFSEESRIALYNDKKTRRFSSIKALVNKLNI